MRHPAWMLVVLLALAQVAVAQEDRKPPQAPPAPQRPRDMAAPPPRPQPRLLGQVYVGDPAPDFELDGSQGRAVKLSSLRGYWVLLVFAESRHSLEPLKHIEPDLRELAVRPVGVCSDKPRALESMAKRDSLPMLLLADVTGEISQLFGLYDYERSVIRPGFLLMDRQGIVRMALLGQTVPMDEVLLLVRYAVTGL